jgi:urease accessory protein
LVANDWLIWQLADSAFPTGGFAHSGGLEALWQHRLIRSSTDLVGFVQSALRQLGRGSLPFANAAIAIPIEQFAEIDRLCDAFTSNHVANRASRLQGQAFLSSAERIFGSPKLKALRLTLRDQELPCHFPPLFGAVCAALNIDQDLMIRLFFFIHLRAWIASAVRLSIVGPLEGQTLQHKLASCAGEIASDCANLRLEDVAQTTPILDLFQATQDRLYSRLFQS